MIRKARIEREGKMKNKFDFTNVVVKEFQPRVFTKDDCRCVREVKYDNTGRIKVAKCVKCGDEVWG